MREPAAAIGREAVGCARCAGARAGTCRRHHARDVAAVRAISGHAHLVARGLNDSHVDAVIEDLAATLRELGVGEDRIAQVAVIANSVRDDVLNRDPQSKA